MQDSKADTGQLRSSKNVSSLQTRVGGRLLDLQHGWQVSLAVLDVVNLMARKLAFTQLHAWSCGLVRRLVVGCSLEGACGVQVAQHTSDSQVLALAWTQDCAGLLVVAASAQVHRSGPAAETRPSMSKSISCHRLCHVCIEVKQPLKSRPSAQRFGSILFRLTSRRSAEPMLCCPTAPAGIS